MVTLGLGMLVWFLLAPPDTADGAWVILGMYDAPEACEQERLARPSSDALICASHDVWKAGR